MYERGIVGSQHREIDADEVITYTLDVSNVGSAAGAVTVPTMKVTRLSDGVDVTLTVTAGALAVAVQVITLLTIQTLTEGKQYRVDVGFTKDGNTLENEFFVDCPDQVP